MKMRSKKQHYLIAAFTIAALLLLIKCKKDEPASGWSYYRKNVGPPVIESMTSIIKNCVPPYPVTFNHVSSNLVGTVKYNWDFGDGTQSTDKNPNHIYSTPGNYQARLVVSNELGADTSYLNLTDLKQSSIPIKPVFSFQHFNNNSFAPNKVIFSNTSSGANQFDWYFGDGGQSTENSPEYIFKTPGNYTVKMRGTCTDKSYQEITQQIDVIDVPKHVFVDSINIMLPSSMNNTPISIELWYNTFLVGKTSTRSGSFPFRFRRLSDFPGKYFDGVQFGQSEVFKFRVMKEGATPELLHEIILSPYTLQTEFYPKRKYSVQTYPAIKDVFLDLYLSY